LGWYSFFGIIQISPFFSFIPLLRGFSFSFPTCLDLGSLFFGTISDIFGWIVVVAELGVLGGG
jgi:hypothetical protein